MSNIVYKYSTSQGQELYLKKVLFIMKLTHMSRHIAKIWICYFDICTCTFMEWSRTHNFRISPLRVCAGIEVQLK